MNRIEFGDCRETMRRWAADGVKAGSAWGVEIMSAIGTKGM